MIEIKQFDGKSITPKDDALMYDLLFNGYGIFNGCSVSFLGANQLMVSSGRLIVRGRQVVITEETIAAQLSSDGTKKGRLYIHIDLSSASNPIEFRTIVADELPALTQEDDVNYSDGVFEVELCNYDVSETAINNIVETCPSITGGVDLLRNMEEVMANTTPGKAADALVVKELTNSLTVPEDGVKYYADKKDGKYGVNTDPSRGADTFIPFSGSNIELLWTNPNPSANFPAQTLSLDLTDYDAVIIELKHNNSATQVRRDLCIKGYKNRVLTANKGNLYDGDMWARDVTVNNDSIVFGAPITSNVQIPTRIYGVKYEDFANLTPIG